MAEALELDPTYLSQLENARRPVDDIYVKKAQKIELSNSVKSGVHPKEDSLPYGKGDVAWHLLPTPMLQAAIKHLAGQLPAAEPTNTEIVRSLAVLSEQLKLRSASEPTVILHEKRKPAPPSSPLTSEEIAAQKAFLDTIPDDVGGDRESQRSRGAGEQHPRKDQPRKPSSSGSKPPPPDV